MSIHQIPKPLYDDREIMALIADAAYVEDISKEDKSFKRS